MPTKADEIRKEIKLKRRQLGHHASFVKNKMTDMLFKELNQLNKQLSIEIDKENAGKNNKYLGKEKSFEQDAKEIDDAQRYRDLTT